MSRWPDNDRTPLARIRVNAGYTIETAAVALGTTGRTLGRYEKADTDVPSRMIKKMASLYGKNDCEVLDAIDGTWAPKEAEIARKAEDDEIVRKALAENVTTQAGEAEA